MTKLLRVAFLTRWQLLNGPDDDQLPTGRDVNAIKFSTHRVDVGPLAEAECLQLVCARIDADNALTLDLAAQIYRSTEGNAYLINQSIECFDPATGKLSDVPLNEVVARRLARLPDRAASLLDVIAVSGHALSAMEASEAAGLPDSSFGTLSRMRNEQLIRLIGSGHDTQVDTYHDKIRETVLENLEESRRRQLHRMLGETIERLERIPVNELLAALDTEADARVSNTDAPARVYDLAYHFSESREHSRALLYSLMAAEYAKQQYALEISLRNFERAQRLAAQRSTSLRYRIVVGLGGTQLLAGHYKEADATFTKALTLAGNERERILARAPQAEIAYKTGSLTESVSVCERLLIDLGIDVPRSKWGLLWSNLRRPLVQSLISLVGRTRRSNEGDWKTSLCIRILHQMSYPCLFRDPLRALWSSAAGYSLAGRLGDPALQCLMATMKALTSAQLASSFAKARRLSDEALAISQVLDDAALQAQALYLRGLSLDPGAHLDEMRTSAEASKQLYLSLGDAWRITYSTGLTGNLNCLLGNVSESIEARCKAFHAATSFNQHRLAETCLGGWALASKGNLPFAKLRARLQLVDDDLSTGVFLKVAESMWHRFHQKPGKALDLSNQAIEQLRSLMPFSAIQQLHPWPDACLALSNHAHCIRVKAESSTEKSPANVLRLRKDAIRAARRAVRFERHTRTFLPYALRELGLAFAGIGKGKKGYRYVIESLQVAEQQGAKHEYALSLHACGQLGAKLGQPESSGQIADAEAQLAEFDQKIEEANKKAAEYLGLES